MLLWIAFDCSSFVLTVLHMSNILEVYIGPLLLLLLISHDERTPVWVCMCGYPVIICINSTFMKHSHLVAALLPFALFLLWFISSFLSQCWWCWGHIWKFRSLAELLIFFWLNTRHGDLSALKTRTTLDEKIFKLSQSFFLVIITFCHRSWSHFLFLPICCFWFACVCV